MALTIYCLGDIPTFNAVLNAVAMIWQTGMMSGPGLGLGAAAGLGLLITLAIALLKAPIAMATGGSAGPGNFTIILIMIVVYSVGSQPMTVNIEDIYTGTTTTVANVPLAVALPGSIVSSVTMSVATKLETALSTVNGNYIALSADGFASPLQLMLSMRGGKYGLPDASPYLSTNIKIFVLDCVAGGMGFDVDAYAKQNIPGINNPIAYITQPGVYHGGLTTIYSSANPQGISDSCFAGATNITTTVAAFVASGGNTPVAGLLNANMNKRASPNTAVPNTYSADDIVAVHDNLINSIWGSSQNAQDFMITALTTAQISDAYNCATSNSVATYNQCTETMTQAMEQWKIDSAGSATGFTKSMVPAMNILLAMFFGFAPLMFIFAMMTGAYGLGILTKFLLFGLWAQTWLPFAVVINFIGQVMVENEFLRLATIAPNGLNPATVAPFYDLLSVKLAIISEMLASVPLISMALLSGSVYGLTQIANNMGKDHIDEKGSAPNLQSTGDISEHGAQLSNIRTPTNTINASSGAIEKSGFESAKIEFGETANHTTGQDAAITTSNQNSFLSEFGKTNATSASKALTSTSLAQIGKTAGASHSKMGQFVNQTANELTDGVKFSDQEKDEVKGTLAVGAMAGLTGNALKKLGSDKAKELISSRTKGETGVQASGSVALSKSKDIGLIDKNSASMSETEINGRTSAITAGESQSLQNTSGYQNLSSVSDGLKSSLQKTVGATQTQKESDSNASTYGAKQGFNLSDLPEYIRHNGAAMGVVNTAMRGASSEQVNRALNQNGLQNVSFVGPNAAQDKMTAAGINLIMNGNDEGMKTHLRYAMSNTDAPTNQVAASVDLQAREVQEDVESGRAALEKEDAKVVKPVAINPSAASAPVALNSKQQGLLQTNASVTGPVGGNVTGDSGTGQYKPQMDAAKNAHKGELNSDTAAAGITNDEGGLNKTTLLKQSADNPLIEAAAVVTAVSGVADVASDLIEKGVAASKGLPAMTETQSAAVGALARAGGVATMTYAAADAMQHGVTENNAIDAIAGGLATFGGLPGAALGATLKGSNEVGQYLNEKTGASDALESLAEHLLPINHAVNTQPKEKS